MVLFKIASICLKASVIVLDCQIDARSCLEMSKNCLYLTGFPMIVWKCEGLNPLDDVREGWNPSSEDDPENVDDGLNTEDVGDP